MSPARKKILAVLIVAAILVVGLLGALSSRTNQAIDEYPEEGSAIDYTIYARIINSDELFKHLGGLKQFDFLAADLHYFGRKTIDAYAKDTKRVIGFEVRGEPQRDGDNIAFKGKYGSSNDSIEVRVTLLKNSRIKTSITNTKTKANLDSELPSNSKDNQFIGSLPFQNELFLIEYNPSVDSFTITGLSPDPSVRQQATDYITNGTGMQKQTLRILYKPFLF